MKEYIQHDIDLVIEMLENEEARDYRFLLDWAIDHDGSENNDIMLLVVKCYQVCAAEGIPTALLNLGVLYYTGRSVPQSYSMAESLYEDAAEKGQYQAYCNLGYIYYYGRVGEADYKKAFECFNRGILLCGDGNCYYKLGDMYRKGLYVDKDSDLAFQLYIRASQSEQTYLVEYLSDVYLRLGECFLHGEGTEKDLDSAIRFLTLAREGFKKRNDGDPYRYTQKNVKKLTHLLAELFKELDEDVSDPSITKRMDLSRKNRFV